METLYRSLQNLFLIAMPRLTDANFARSVVYICAHNAEGAMGVMVNRPLQGLQVQDVFSQMHIKLEYPKHLSGQEVYFGGPIQPERGFILHRPNGAWESSIITSPELALTSSQDVLQSIAKGEGPEEFIITLGYAAWNNGQLEEEIAHNFWLTAHVDPDILFKIPSEERWRAAVALLGVDVSYLSGESGHG